MIYRCCDERRRAAVDTHPTLNGIDWLEVLDNDAPAGSPRQQSLMVRLLKPVPAGIGVEQVRIVGGERVDTIAVLWVAAADTPPPEATPVEQTFFAGLAEPANVLVVRTDRSGDFSGYRLRLVRGSDDDGPLPDFDPRLSDVDFSFKAECPSDFDCLVPGECDEPSRPEPDIDYLAKDYAGFRQRILDRLSTLQPDWRDRNAADLGVTLAELLAYVGDHLSYWQDAVATEAYLHTARRRVSVQRHARLVDYQMHNGANARAWLRVLVNAGPVVVTVESLRFYTRAAGVPDRITPDSPEEREALRQNPVWFEPLHDATLYAVHNEMAFYTWGDQRCCLPAGATQATLRGHYPDLAVGDVLIFQEMVGPLTGRAEDADRTHRHAVRLTGVQAFDGVSPLVDPLDDTEITAISWHAGDALPFPLCLSAQTSPEHGAEFIDDVSLALGNVLLVDHGRTLADEPIGTVPEPLLYFPADKDADHCNPQTPVAVPPRFRPRLGKAPLTHAGTVRKVIEESGSRRVERLFFDPQAAATEAFRWQTADVMPQVSLVCDDDGQVENWAARGDLLNSGSGDHHFVAEVEQDGSARLRFGDDVHGERPNAGTTFSATYRVGNGTAGNVGAEAIAHVVTTNGSIDRVINPLPARGGVNPETMADVRRRAPHAFRTQERAVTPDDYARVTERYPGVQRAAGTLRWTGSWHTVFTTVDRVGGTRLDPAYRADLKGHIERFRMAGHDLALREPVHVSLEIDLFICVAPSYFRSDVRAALLVRLGSGVMPDGQHALFHPDEFSFGQTVYLSTIYAAAREVPGVDSVRVTRFHRQGDEDNKPLADGLLTLGRLEIPRLENNPNFPEHGVLRLELSGGK